MRIGWATPNAYGYAPVLVWSPTTLNLQGADRLSSENFENNPNSSRIEMPCLSGWFSCLSRWFSWLWRHAMSIVYWEYWGCCKIREGCFQGGEMKPDVKTDDGFETCLMRTEKTYFQRHWAIISSFGSMKTGLHANNSQMKMGTPGYVFQEYYEAIFGTSILYI